MDIKANNIGSTPVVSSQKLELPVQPSQGVFYPPSVTAAEEIIDYVEIQSNSYQPAPTPNRPSSYPIRTDKSCRDKGTLIDIWI